MKYVDPKSLKAVWPEVERGLLQILRRCPQPWSPEDVKSHLKQLRAYLYADEDGFFIVEKNQEPHRGTWYLNVWCMYFRPGKGREKRADLIALLDRLKDEALCDYITFTSPRGAWSKALDGYFTLHSCNWRRE